MIESGSLLRLNKDLVKQASICCARAFEDDPYILSLIPDKQKRTNLWYSFAYYLSMSVNGSNEAFTTSPGCEGVALWVSPGRDLPSWSFLRGGNPFLPLRCGWRFVWGEFSANRYCQKIKKRYAPERHLYLALLAVDPAFQGKGFATMLLKPALKKADEQHLPCYLETQNRKNEAMYQHFGFKTVFEAEYPGTHTPVIAMLRK
jgi:GNAT superfamily N-acetyltransferase